MTLSNAYLTLNVINPYGMNLLSALSQSWTLTQANSCATTVGICPCSHSLCAVPFAYTLRSNLKSSIVSLSIRMQTQVSRLYCIGAATATLDGEDEPAGLVFTRLQVGLHSSLCFRLYLDRIARAI